MPAAELVLQYLANGVVFGGILALAAIGLSLVYGILNLSNFAHGDYVALGAFAVLLFGRDLVGILPEAALLIPLALLAGVALDAFWTRRLTRGERGAAIAFAAILLVAGLALRLEGAGDRSTNTVLVVGTLVGIVATAAVILGFEFLVWRPLRRKRATALTLIIVSIGIALIVRNGLLQRFGGSNQSFRRPSLTADEFFGVLISDAQQFTLVVAVVLIALVHAFLRYTRSGKAMRALADNPDLARVSGIDVDRMIVYVWLISAALVTVAGVLLALVQNNSMNANMGFSILIALFASVIVGGIGSAYGAMLGGLVVGVAMKTSALWLGTQYEVAASFLVLIAVLLVRPQGLLGVKA